MNDDAAAVLLVEDNPYDAEMTLRAFRKNDFPHRIHWVRDGEEALNVLQSGVTPKLVLLDLKMPKVDGWDVLRAIRSDERMITIPVVVMTSSTHDTDIEESYRLGANGYTVKPIDFGHFSEVISWIGLYWLLVNKLPGDVST